MDRSRRLKFYLVQFLTLVRVPLIFAFVAVTISSAQPPSSATFLLAFSALLLSALTDLLDGYLARKFRVTSRLGSYTDPLTDKVFYLTTFPTLLYLAGMGGHGQHVRSLLILTILFLLRDQWVSFLRSIGALHRLNAEANWSGKARTAISFPTVCAIYYYLQAPPGWTLLLPAWSVYGLEALSMVINLISIVVYTIQFWPAVRAEMRLPAEDR